MKISILGSGSGGNATFIESGETKILIDAGFSGKKIEERLNTLGYSCKDVDAILITHEHGDHIAGAGILSRKYDIPIYITRESYEEGEKKLGKIGKENLNFLGRDFKISNKIKVRPFDVMHDAKRTVGYRIVNASGKKIAVATDIGYVNNVVREYFKDADAIVIEANYDFNMLMECSYPWALKDRVKSRNGHLENIEAAKLVEDVYHPGLQKVYLVHVSKDSNEREIAYNTVVKYLKGKNIFVEVEVATQDIPTEIFEI